jgi:glutamyl-Q tRNA(Asp) synthetase
MASPIFRFAPSPNGHLHLGHALSALLNHDLAMATGGHLLLRIEDIDVIRCDKSFEAAILDDLKWLGVRFETQVRRQSEHFDDYARMLRKLGDMGLIYPAFQSRTEVRAAVVAAQARGEAYPHDPDGAPLYPGADRDLHGAEAEALMIEGRPHAFRLNMAKASTRFDLCWHEWSGTEGGAAFEVPADPTIWGDVILARKDVPTSYHLSVVVDDALQGITHVVRGRDLYHATAVHRLLQHLLGLPAPVYHHHRLITDDTGRKLAKSERDTSLQALRANGATPADIRRLVGLPLPAA